MVGREMTGRWLAGLDRQQRARLLSPFVGQSRGAFVTSENAADLGALRTLMDAGTVTPVVDRRYALEQTTAAIGYLRNGRARGKVAIAV